MDKTKRIPSYLYWWRQHTAQRWLEKGCGHSETILKRRQARNKKIRWRDQEVRTFMSLMFLEEEWMMQSFTENFNIQCNLEEKVLLCGISLPTPFFSQQIGPFLCWPSEICDLQISYWTDPDFFNSFTVTTGKYRSHIWRHTDLPRSVQCGWKAKMVRRW